MDLVNDNVVLLAGVTGRIGGAPLATFVREGARVGVISRERARAQAKIDEMLAPAERERTLAIGADLDDPASCTAAVTACVNAFGRLDALVNLAGAGWRRKPMTDATLDDLRETLSEVVETAYNISRAALQAMLAQPYREGARSRGRIVTVTATSAHSPNPNFSAYTTAKAGVNGLMLAIAREYRAQGIVANALLSGGVAFPGAAHFRSEEHRAAAVQPDEIADALVFLASDAASGINGALIDITGRIVERGS
jgi:NAD(P)-dependent dehydrogenase (short-subunit alcohol dehydrogenase family)